MFYMQINGVPMYGEINESFFDKVEKIKEAQNAKGQIKEPAPEPEPEKEVKETEG